MTFLQEPPPGRKCNATVINIGTLNSRTIESMAAVLHRGLDNLSENALLSGKQAVDAAADFIHVFP